jgi:hypothetical protein
MLDAGQDWGPYVLSRPNHCRPIIPKLLAPARSLSQIDRDLTNRKAAAPGDAGATDQLLMFHLP